jgi:hypothetical protein
MAILAFPVVEMNKLHFSAVADCDDVAVDSSGSNIVEEGTEFLCRSLYIRTKAVVLFIPLLYAEVRNADCLPLI